MRRCRGEEPALDTPSAGRALLGSAAPQGALQGAVPWGSRDPSEGPWPIRRHFCRPLHQGASSPQPGSQEPLWREPCWRSHDSHKALWPMRSSSLDTPQGALYSQSRDSHEALWPVSSSCCATLHQGAPPCGKRESHEPLRQEPCWGSRDCLEALRCAPHWKPRDSQDALRPAREALPEPLRRGAPGLRSRDAREAPQPIRSSACGALQGAPLQQPLGEAPEAPLWVRGTPVGLRGICGLGVTCGPGGAFVGLGGHLWVMGILFGTAGHLWVRVVTCGSAGHLWAKVVTCGLGRHFWVRKSLVVLPPPVTRRPPRPFGGPAPLDAAMPPPNHKGTASVGHPHPQILGVCPCASARSP